MLLAATKKFVLCSILIYTVLVAALIAEVFVKTGHFVYPLDDAYIHLALAEQLAHGHYGTNPGEFASPSSSLLWPFLLIPFAGTRFHVFVPLVLNFIIGTMVAMTIGVYVAKWSDEVKSRAPLPFWQQVSICSLLILTANIVSLTLSGMEAVLQIGLALICAVGVAELMNHGRLPKFAIIAAAIAPSVRYENLSLTLAICIVLVSLKRWRAAIGLFAIAVTPLLLFALFLKVHGLPGLPTSVLVKGDVYTASTPLGKLIHIVQSNLLLGGHELLQRTGLISLSLAFVVLTILTRERIRRTVFACAALVGILELTVGRYGWFHRYEVYALIFMTVLMTRVLFDLTRFRTALLIAVFLLAASPYFRATIRTPNSSLAVYRQQYQLHRFLNDYYSGNVAVNDLGLTSFQRTHPQYILDVAGLGSFEAAQHPFKEASWMSEAAQEHHIQLATLYPQYYHIPASWTPLAQMCEIRPPAATVLKDCVVFFSTAPEYTSAIRSDLERFAPTLPTGVLLEPPDSRGLD